jgi:hypothetical protein
VNVDPEVLLDAEHKLRAALLQRIEEGARAGMRSYLLANPASTPAEMLNGMFDLAAVVNPDDVITAMVAAIRNDDVAVGAQRRLTWIGP